jgi:hypothetical protein
MLTIERKLRGTYVEGWQAASGNWMDDIIANQEDSFPLIHEMFPGTLNIRLEEPQEYVPSDISKLRAIKNQSCISKVVRVVNINDQSIEAFIYDGGWPANTLELLARENLSKALNLGIGDTVILTIEENAVAT